jgi:hypothetical protein
LTIAGYFQAEQLRKKPDSKRQEQLMFTAEEPVVTRLFTMFARVVEFLTTGDDWQGEGGVAYTHPVKNMSLHHCIAVCFVDNKPKIKFIHSSNHTEFYRK